MPQALTISERRKARNFAVASAAMVAVGLLGAALASGGRAELPPKSGARVAIAIAPTREPEPFAPRVARAEEPLNALKAGIVWSAQAEPVSASVVALPRQAAASRVRRASSAPLPPRRPAVFPVAAAQPPVEGPPVFVAPPPARPRIAGYELPGFVPTGAALLRRIGDVGSSIGNVGSSLGRMMRISSR